MIANVTFNKHSLDSPLQNIKQIITDILLGKHFYRELPVAKD